MSVFEEVFAISSSNGKIREFFEFANDIHQTLECTNTDCGIFKFLKPIEEALPDGRCCHNHLEMVFINQCVKYTNIFANMFKLSKSNGNKALLEKLKKKTSGQSQEQREIENQIKEVPCE